MSEDEGWVKSSLMELVHPDGSTSSLWYNTRTGEQRQRYEGPLPTPEEISEAKRLYKASYQVSDQGSDTIVKNEKRISRNAYP